MHQTKSLPSVDELLALDVLTLRDHTERAGDAFDVVEQRARLQASLRGSEVCSVRRDGALVAYAMLKPDTEVRWFVGAFVIHPACRKYAVIRQLLAETAALAQQHGISELSSHVYKTNQRSIAFHRKLGFQVTRQNDKAYEFHVQVRDLADTPGLRRAMAKATAST